MKYVLIGCGRVAVNHLNAAIDNKLEIAGLCDVSLDHIDALLNSVPRSKEFSFNRFTDYKAMIDEVKPQLAAIATDSGLHAEIALYCIEKGIHVILEKPVALSMADAEKLVRVSEEKGVWVSTCHQGRFNKAVVAARKAIETGRLGRLSHAAVAVRWYRGKEYYDQASWRGTWEMDGGTLMNQCIHGIDMLRWMMGDEVEEVYGATRQRFHDYIEAEDIGMAIVKFKNGAIGTIEGTTNIYPDSLEETLLICGEKGTIRLGGSCLNHIDVWQLADETEEDRAIKSLKEHAANVYGNGHSTLYADMIDAVKNNRRPAVDIRAGRNSLEMVLAIYKSQKEGKPVKLPLTDFSTLDMVGEFGK